MNAKGRFGLIIPEINSPLDRDLVEGAFAQAEQLGYDLVVYTGVLNSMRGIRFDAYIAGLENIYTLICLHKLDGIIFAAERFHTQEVIDKIGSYLMQTNTPCLVLGGELQKKQSMEADEYSSMYRITRHMTDEHGCKKLYCLAGVKGHKSSEERLHGFKDACKDSGISISESDIFYGNFWKDVPAQLGIDIANKTVERPDAVICCNDVMAVTFIESLKANGIRVPEDIKVTGFDGGWDSIMCQPTVTTVTGRDKQFGADAVCRLYAMTVGSMPKQEFFTQSIRFGRSCGCHRESAIEPHLLDMILMNRKKRDFIATDFIHRMSEASDIEELSERIDEVGHIFSGVDWLDICLCSDWQGDMNNPDDFRQYGCSDEMYLLLSKRYGDNEKAFYSFKTADILPSLNVPHEPHLIVLTSLHCSGQIFGYTAAAYTNSRYICADEYYVSWCDSVSNGIKSLQKRLFEQHFSSQLEKLSETDPVTGIYNRRGFMLHTTELINQYNNENRKSCLLLITYYPQKVGAVDPQTAIDSILMNICSHRICARLSDNIYGVIIPSNDEEGIINTSENLIAAIESDLRERFGDVRLPEFVTYTSSFISTDSSDIEKTVYEAIESLTYKRKAAESNYTDYREQIYRLRRNMISQPQKDWDIEKISHDIGISRSHLQRLYKQLFGTSIKDDVINARIKRAKQLLAHTDMRIVEIAEQCGYNNEHHFMRQFKEKCGVTAAQFRKNP
jgi:DNA-binding LacI/PurR family transcriptional regulator/AraC-like DNA-binding protein